MEEQICEECGEVIIGIEVVCPDCSKLICERCSEQTDGELCCPGCADERNIRGSK